MAYHKFNLLLHDNMHISHQITVQQYIILILCVKHVFVYLYLRCHLLILSLFTLYYSVKYCSFVHMKWNYNPQIEMFARFKMKSSFHKTKRII